MTEENIRSEEESGSAQTAVQEAVPEAAAVPEEISEAAPAAEPVSEAAAEIPAEESAAESVTETDTIDEAVSMETENSEKKEEQPEIKKEKKPCKLVTYFAGAENAGSLTVKCFLMFLLSAVCAYAGLMLWGLIDKLIPTFYTAAYWAVGTAAAFLLAGIVLIIVMIVRFVRGRKKRK